MDSTLSRTVSPHSLPPGRSTCHAVICLHSSAHCLTDSKTEMCNQPLPARCPSTSTTKQALEWINTIALRRQLSSCAPNLRKAHAQILVVQVDDQDRKGRPHGPPWDEGVLPKVACLWGGTTVFRGRAWNSDIKLVVLRVTEWGARAFDNKVFCTLVCKAYQELHYVICWKIYLKQKKRQEG